ncbi:MAG: VanZ family protein [Verrucomicrobiales bacterium]|nr:VanZ family protein [Verrucomicrobiales bacterium]
MIPRIGLAVFLPFLATVIYLANRGKLPGMLSFVDRIPYGDTLGHFFLMGIFAFLATGVSGGRCFLLMGLRIPIGAGVVFVIVLLEEFSQLFVASRTFSWLDLAADFLGILLFGWWASRVYGSWRAESAEEPSG